jgi:Family of unknown function (DUF5329)
VSVRPARRSFALFCLLALPAAGRSAPRPEVSAEIEQLFAALLASGCRFSRNGQWYDAATAARHMREKYDYLLKFNMVSTTESFIERAATQSSMTGQPYLVDCGSGGAAVPSAQWFSNELRRKRGSK